MTIVYTECIIVLRPHSSSVVCIYSGYVLVHTARGRAPNKLTRKPKYLITSKLSATNIDSMRKYLF